MKRLLLIMSLVLLVALAACSTQTPATPTAPAVEAIPTEVPPTEVPPVVEPTAEPAPAFEADPALIDTLWVWTSRDAAEPLDVSNPENYNLLFNDDGTFFAGLDCNRGSGTYATPGDGTITMELGPITRAMCAEDSLSDTMIAMFPAAASYAIENDGDVLAITMADGSVDRYSKADTLTEAMPPMKDADTGLIDRVWQWTSREADGRTTTIATPENYTLTFNNDGSFYARLDCNTGGGSYSSDAPGSLTFSMVRSTLAMCPPKSMAGDMTTLFEQTVTYAIADDGLTLTLTHEDGTVDTYVSAAMSTPTLTATTWQWLGTTTPTERITVADSSRYTIEFLDDGTAAIKADCNRVAAQYTAEDGALSITPGPTTLAACPEDSQADVFVQQLAASGLYFFQDGDLYIDLFADAGTMRFGALPNVDLPAPTAGAAIGTVNAPDGIFLRTGPGTNFAAVGAAPQGETAALSGMSEDGEWYVVEAPGFPNGQVWVAAAFVDAENAGDLPVVAAPVNVPSQSLVGPTWLWTGTVTPVETIDVADPSRYTIDFFDDGTAGIGADCNRVMATWTADGQSITITPGPSTLAACPDDSQADAFIQQLSNAAVFFFQGNDLFIDQVASAGTLRFIPSVLPQAPVAPEQPVEAPGLPFRVVSFGPTGSEQPVIEGTLIDAVFDQTGGTVSGTSGCNNYSGPMNTTDGGFALGPFASTAMACPEPEGVMEQEAAYLAALAGATGFQWSVQPNSFITNGQITYALPDGTTGMINLVSP